MIQEGARECKYRQVQKSNGMDAKKKQEGRCNSRLPSKLTLIVPRQLERFWSN
jgi:hypothetical protein